MSYGGRERENSHSGRTDVDAILEAKEDLINYYLDLFADDNEKLTDEFKVVYAGGIRYDAVELRLADDSGDDRHFLRIRSSGTEPINRVYVESSDKDKAPLLMQTVLDKLEELIIREINTAQSEWRMVEVLSMTRTSPQILKSVNDALERRKWSREDITGKLKRFVDDRTFLEGRNRRMVHSWLEALK